ncbi:DUF4249 domain-containing protein [Dyadobacter sp. CY345]|uniref:DUF4249 domain-containing protein n=1 Tax=Dyadobacter sp. CY345 TaxID=2909335 RepID=UPI001F36FFA8|nr:DUF4249 domain-containing protein [Dyadobacter sp. CY345]MCF2445607.1 DUF4249 domain-containing protein [Dyadobacter sp. CY345]
MKRYCAIIAGFLCFAFFINGCVEPFSPPEVNTDEGYLVIDGFLNVGTDTSRIELSHTQNANATTPVIKESSAAVSVEEENGVTYDFVESGNGAYFLPPQQFNKTSKYRLRVKTAFGKEYLSDYVEVKDTPPIDNIEGKVDTRQDAMVMQVNTHDPANQTRFYRWKFEETWQYRSAFYSSIEIVKKPVGEGYEIVSRREDVNLCWRTLKSANILLGSTVKLSQDVIKDLPLTAVPIASNKLYIKYSILVKQYGLTQDAFEYWTGLAKTTEGTGSLFDPLPSQITGNIKNTTDAQDLVFGYFSASVEQKKRIFLTPNLGTFPRCNAPDTLTIAEALEVPGSILTNYFGPRSEFVLTTSQFCADCRAQGGTISKPSFWE